MLIHFVRNGPAYLPELDAYQDFIESCGHDAIVHQDASTIWDNAEVIWWMCGRVSWQQAFRFRRAFHVHEYASASVPPHPWMKDQIKRLTHPKPDFIIYQNSWVKEQLSPYFYDVTFAYRDMGVADSFLQAGLQKTAPPRFDLVYLGEMGRLEPFMPLLHAIHDAGRKLLLIGEIPPYIDAQLPPSVFTTGRVSHDQVPSLLRHARYGLNLVSNTRPYNQQTSTKLVEYCAVGLPVVSNDYEWVRWFANKYQAQFHLLKNDPASWISSFGEALDAFPYVIPDVSDLRWQTILKQLPIWKMLGITAEQATRK
jgi:glycosyltransferase involved in cell wall biosynthesis